MDGLAELRALVVDDEALIDRLLRASARGQAALLDEAERIGEACGLAVSRAAIEGALDAARIDRRARWV